MLQLFFGFVFLSSVSQLQSLTGAQAECPLQLNPQRVVVRYGGSVAVNCKTSVLHKGIGWEAIEGAVPMTKNQNLITWRVLNLTEWDIKPFCYIFYKIGDKNQCIEELPVAVYKTPDSVSIRTVIHRGPMIEGQQYELQCDVHDVAPVEYLTVKWYKGHTLLNQTTFTDTIETPVNKAVTLLIRPNRADDGAQYWCEAELDLGAEGPQPPPKNSSKPLNVEVYYKPQHSSSTETIIKDDKVMLDCTVKANPAPDYTWSSDHLKEKISSSVIKSSALSPGKYTCTTSNSLGRDSKVFILKSTVSHTLITTYTGVNGQTVAGTPECSSVTTLDGQQIDYYDSEIQKLIPKQDWMKEFASTEKWKEYTEIRERVQQINKLNIPDLMQRFSQTGGVQKYQRVYGCDWDDVTGHIYGFDKYSYDGKDFISLDLKEIRYTASVPQAGPTVMKWNEDRERLAYLKRYYRDECVYWLKQLVHFPKASLKKTGTVPESTEPSLREPAVNDNKRDGSASYSSYIMPTVVIIILVILILSVLYGLWKNWNHIKPYYKKVIYKKEDESE